MGDMNQFNFIKSKINLFKGPVLEVGSLSTGGSPDLRMLFPGESYMGADMTSGKGVDRVIDFTASFNEVDRALDKKRFASILCLSVLEHCGQPFNMADNLTKLLSSKGRIYVSVPFAWKFHGYPSDYWRFTDEGVKKLFPRIRFDSPPGQLSTSFDGELFPLDKELGRIRMNGSGALFKKGRQLGSVELVVLRLAGALGLLRKLSRYRYLMPPTMINMTGTRATKSMK